MRLDDGGRRNDANDQVELLDEAKAEQIDPWEEASICSRLHSEYYGCLKGRDEAQAQAVYNRLCKLDAGAAMLLGAPKGPQNPCQPQKRAPLQNSQRSPLPDIRYNEQLKRNRDGRQR
jgi:hypothetical protein